MIGVFDSGIGGLSIHRALVERLPMADFLYLADQAHAPYGLRSSEEIVELTRDGCIRLFEEGASLVVLACNTAAAIALRSLQRDWLPDYRKKLNRPVNVIGLIVPTIEAATGLSWQSTATHSPTHSSTETIGVFATSATVNSNVYVEEIHKRRPDITVVQEACTDLARLIEAGAEHAILEEVVENHVQALRKRITTPGWRAILGCTHYEIVSDIFTRALPAGTKLIHQPSATADALIRYLSRHPEYATGQNGIRRFITTGKIAQNHLVEAFWSESLVFEQ